MEEETKGAVEAEEVQEVEAEVEMAVAGALVEGEGETEVGEVEEGPAVRVVVGEVLGN